LAGRSRGDEAAVGLPAYSLRVSSRARHVRLVVTAAGDLVVVVPQRFDRRRLPAILESKRSWIERALARIAARRAAAESSNEAGGLPGRIVLPALDETWEVEYRQAPAGTDFGGTKRTRGVAREMASGRLLVSMPTGDEEAARRALLHWLRRRAQRHLPVRLDELATRHGLAFQSATVRHQRTRWGSCSPRGTISLNLRLLFLAPVLVDHVLLHELCHLRELNHSKRFWALLLAHDPDCALHRRQTRDAWHSLPGWVQPVESGARELAGGRTTGPASGSAVP
jgi:predicted metal-dependent hydrolase